MPANTSKALWLTITDTYDQARLRLARTLNQAVDELSYRVALHVFPAASREAYVLCLPDHVTLSPPETIPKPVETLATIARRHLRSEVVEVVNYNTAAMGRAAVPIERLLDTSRRTDTASLPETLVADVLADLTETAMPHFLQVVVAPDVRDTAGIAASIRVCTFPTALTRDAHADRLRNGEAPLARHLESGRLTTNQAFLTDSGWQVRQEDRLPGPPQSVLERELDARRHTPHVAAAAEMAFAAAEFNHLRQRVPDTALRSTYRELGAEPWVDIDVEQLTAVCALRPVQYDHSPWAAHDGRDHPQRTAPGDDPSATGSDWSAPVEATCTNLGLTDTVTDERMAFVQAALRWLLEHGDQLEPAPIELAVPAALRHRPTGERTLLLFVADPTEARGEVVAAARHATAVADGLTVMTPTQDAGERLAQTLLWPVKEITDLGNIRLFKRLRSLKYDDELAVQDRDDLPVRWSVRPGRDGTVSVTSGQSDAMVIDRPISLQSLTESFDRLVPCTDDTFDLVAPSGTTKATYANWDAARAHVKPVAEPAFPGTIAAGLETATVFANGDTQFHEVRPIASWDTQSATLREATAAARFLKQFTIPSRDTALHLETVRPQFASWLRHQTDELLTTSLDVALRHGYAKLPDVIDPISATATALPTRDWLYSPFDLST